MKLTDQKTTKTKASYTLTAEDSDLEHFREAVASSLSSTVKVPGFRPNKAPTDMILKYADQQVLQNDFLNHAVNDLYVDSQKMLNLRIVGEPKIEVTKFVPYSMLEIKVEVPIVKDIKLPNYKSIKLDKKSIKVTDKQLELSLKDLQKRAAGLKPVDRAAKKGDLVILDFEGSDTKTKEDLPSAGAKDFRLIIGDNTLIPGFEDNLIGLKVGKSKAFDLTFPSDYHDKSFASRKVTFKANVKTVNSVDLPKIDDEFAKLVGPFDSLTQLKAEIKKQLEAESTRQSNVDLENQILNFLAEKTIVELDDNLIESEFNILLDNAKKSAVERGQTWKEFLASRGESEQQYEKQLKEVSISRIKGGLAIGEIASKEGISITDTELNQHISNLKNQYSDPVMRAELDKQENRRELGVRLLTEKVLDYIQDNQTKKTKSVS